MGRGEIPVRQKPKGFHERVGYPERHRGVKGPVRIGLVVVRATESSPASTADPRTTSPFGSTEADCDALAVEVPLAVSSEVEVSLFRLTVGVDTGV